MGKRSPFMDHISPFLILDLLAFEHSFLLSGLRVKSQQLIVFPYVQELIKFAMTHEGASHVNIISSIVVDTISSRADKTEGLDAKDRENISCLFLEVRFSIISLMIFLQQLNCHNLSILALFGSMVNFME